MLDIKAAVAIVGGLVVLWYYLGATLDKRFPPGRRLRDLLLAATGLVAFACWWNLGRFHFDGLMHYYEFYHYYLGAKYAPELGYTRLYECTVAAEDEFAHLGARLERIEVRDLTNNVLTSSAEALAHPERCKQHFTPERWQAFMRDSDYFRAASDWGYWSSALKDHGYNATPVWRLAAGFLANLAPASYEVQLRLSYLDPILLFAMALSLWWAFGWRTAAVCIIFWGTNYPARYWWNGGAFLRMDWLFASVLSVCLMKKGRPLGAGVAIGVATLLRIFPGFIAAALVLKVIVQSIRDKKLVVSPAQRRFIAGGALAVIVLVPLSAWYGGGFDCWRGFVENSRKHVSTPLTNNMGLKTVLAFSIDKRAQLTRDDSRDPFGKWKHFQQSTFHHRVVAFAALVLVFLIMMARALWKHDDWVALVLGVGLIVVAVQLTSYYFSVLLLFGTLWTLVPFSGCLVLFASALSCIAPNYWYGWDDVRFMVVSVLYVAVAAALTVALGHFQAAPEDQLAPGMPAPTPPEESRARGLRKGRSKTRTRGSRGR